MTAKPLHGEPVATAIRADVRDRLARLRDEHGRVPTLGTVLVSDDPADERFMDLKHAACDEVGIETRDRRLAPDAAAEELYRAVERLSEAASVDAVFVQTPLPPTVPAVGVGTRIDPRKDVDCFHPENRGRLVAGEPRFVPATTAAVRRLLAAYDLETAGRDVVVVGRSPTIGTPLANRLFQRAGGNATVTVCHSHTNDLGTKTRRADVVVAACGVPELVDGSMLSPGVVVVDVSANRRRGATGTETVGDVDYDSAQETAAAVTPVPGGVGPVTVAALLDNVVLAAERRSDGDDRGTGRR
ncbi:bifunctional 5,10-methylenetetrahydrofolate dehydrogenase/5,10-methenyltetrahydrofolate cyclohydrolase [Salinigranum marinum]|uniref:bifunctional 5,10-methylenetetrahydrofolate dehydrogenase/5,10-methenyltetrahydrofolate cyclohydrolase n=1 Tax=Salinigranum marinum TaxID=1515595 RepID=UPI002989D494|nr:tetrahydrofolate dehydrogenase/cyclohydrolase catalytic domain-containing protein [Salinigranum marinum]